ncbi:MAG: hypothetical protein KA318_00210 [Nitrosomonas sp.]|nr:hypothetical protein [Nitrosomonas sp.]
MHVKITNAKEQVVIMKKAAINSLTDLVMKLEIDYVKNADQMNDISKQAAETRMRTYWNEIDLLWSQM